MEHDFNLVVWLQRETCFANFKKYSTNSPVYNGTYFRNVILLFSEKNLICRCQYGIALGFCTWLKLKGNAPQSLLFPFTAQP